MIKPINITPLNTTTQAYFKCDSCGFSDTISFTNKVIDIDDESDLDYLNQTECPDCGKRLG